MTWIKNINNKWTISTNDIQYGEFKENLKSTDKLNITTSDKGKAVIYIPTHNIHDVYEWFRIFKDSYNITNNTDRMGFAIHGYFNKKRTESIQGYFPNLIEVKASSTSVFKYYFDTTFYYRSSIDYIEDTSITFPTLTIDNVEIFNEESILLKNQLSERISLYPIITVNGVYYIDVQSPLNGRIAKLTVGNKCIVKNVVNSVNTFTEDVITKIEFTTTNIGFGSNDYLIMSLGNTYSSVLSMADLVLGDWTIVADGRDHNGVYQYLNQKLIYLPDMEDQYKIYNQIVYTYQGETNENKQFYLRRDEDVNSSTYSMYPTAAQGTPLIYSEGDAHLIKCRIEYNLDPTNPLHPSGPPPYAKDSNAYKMLFLDKTQATKVLSTNADGIGEYMLENDVPIGVGDITDDSSYVDFTIFNQDYNGPSVITETTGKIITPVGNVTLSTATFVSAPSSLYFNPYTPNGTFNTSQLNAQFIGSNFATAYTDPTSHIFTFTGETRLSADFAVSGTTSLRIDSSAIAQQTKLELLFTGANGSTTYTDQLGVTTVTGVGSAQILNNKLRIFNSNSGIRWAYNAIYDTSTSFKITFNATVTTFVDEIPLFTKGDTPQPVNPIGLDVLMLLYDMDRIIVYNSDNLTQVINVVISTSPFGSALSVGVDYSYELRYDGGTNTVSLYINNILIDSNVAVLTNAYTGLIQVGYSNSLYSLGPYYTTSDVLIDNFRFITPAAAGAFAYVTIPNSPAIDLQGDCEFTFSFLITQTVTSYVRMFTRGVFGSGNEIHVGIIGQNNLQFTLGAANYNIDMTSFFGSPFSLNTWYSFSYRYLNGFSTFKINNTPILSLFTAPPATNGLPIILGDDANYSNEILYIDDLTIGTQNTTFQSSYLKINYDSILNFNLDFTIDFRFRVANFVDAITFFNKSNSFLNISDLKIVLLNMNNINVYLNGSVSPSINTPFVFSLNTWYQYQLIYKQGIATVKINTVVQGSPLSITINNNSVYDLFINVDNTVSLTSSQSRFYLDDFQITKHVFVFNPYYLNFNNTDILGNDNTLMEYEKDIFTDTPQLPTYTFKHKSLNSNESYSVSFTGNDAVLNQFALVTPLANTTNLILTYDTSVPNYKIFPPDPTVTPISVNTFNVGDIINIKIEFSTGTDFYTALDEQFILTAVNQCDTLGVDLEVFPKFDPDFMDEFNSFSQDPYLVRVTVGVINVYGDQIFNYASNPEYSVQQLFKAFDKSIISKIYNFSYEYDSATNDIFLRFNKIKQNHKWKWSNHGNVIDSTHVYLDPSIGPGDPGYPTYLIANGSYSLEHVMDANIRKYFYGYDIADFLYGYLDVTTPYIAQNLTTTNFTYNNNAASANRFGVEGGNRTGTSGNIILFGANLRDYVLDNIKPHTLCSFVNNTTVTTTSMTVVKVEYDNDLKLGKITTLNDLPIPSTGNSISIKFENNISNIAAYLNTIFDKTINIKGDPSLNDFSYITHPDYKPDTASYAYGLLNYGKVSNAGFVKDADLLTQITGIVYKEFNEPKISFLKRDKYFEFDNNIIYCAVQTVANLNLASALDTGGFTTTLNTVLLSIGDLVIVTSQSTASQNGIYVYTGVGQPYVRYSPFNKTIFWLSGLNGLYYQAVYNDPLNLGSTSISFVTTVPSLKKDDRLVLRPIEIARLGVDNKTQPWQKIYYKYDSLELEENKLNIQIGINNRRRIRFIDGLTEYNIINNINGQGIYAWILDDDVIVDDAIVGCTQLNGPGTGQLIWYRGTWENGIWVDGIWIQGEWMDGVWLNGTFNTHTIQDFYNYVTIDYTSSNIGLSTWHRGTWVNGTFNNGRMLLVNWQNGTFNNGVFVNGSWVNGTFNRGIINNVDWQNGIFNGGDFEKGIWRTGVLNEIDPTNPSRFGTKAKINTNLYTDRAIWFSGLFNGGEFHAGDGEHHNASVFYSGSMESARFISGTFISGTFNNSVWYDGVFMGGYYITSMADVGGSNKQLTIDPAQYESTLYNVTTLGDPNYIANSSHNLSTYQKEFYLLGTPVSPNTFSWNAFLNVWYDTVSALYSKKQYINNTTTDNKMTLSIDPNPANTVYVAENIGSNIPKGDPFICATFTNSTWKKGLFMNGYMDNTIWETGNFLNGYANNITFGVNSYS